MRQPAPISDADGKIMALLSPSDLRQLEGLRFQPAKSFAGRVRGERLTKKRGLSIEFADYRDYTEGDDLRHLDWNVLARLETPIMKTYRDEEDLAVHLLLDGSLSMDFGDPTKFELAKKLAAMTGYLALAGGDALHPRLLGPSAQPPAFRGRISYHRLVRWLADRKPDSSQALSPSLRSFTQANLRTGLVVLLSDGLDPALPQAIRALAARGHELFFLQILSAAELDPDLEGDLRLLDAEGGQPTEITANSFALKEYRKRLAAHLENIQEAVRRAGGRYALVESNQSMREILQNVLKREGWVRS